MNYYRPLVELVTLIGVLLCAFGDTKIHAGESVIFRNSDSKIRIPTKELRNETITPNSEGFDKKHNSVEGVMAPWQNPMKSRSASAQARLMKALDRQKNWMLQDPEELLSSKELSSDADLDDLEFSSTRGRGRFGGRTAFERYYTKRETTKRFGSGRNSNRNSNYSDASDGGNGMDEMDDERPQDSFASPKYFEARFDSIFDDPNKAAGIKVTGGEGGADETGSLAQEKSIAVFTSAFPDLGVRPRQQQASSQNVEGFQGAAAMDMTPASQMGFSTGFEQASVAASINFGASSGANIGISGASSPVLDGFRSTISESLGAQSGLSDAFSGSAFDSSGGASTLGLFDSNPAAQSIRNRPAVFELPERSF
jgi:hypothetical protein